MLTLVAGKTEGDRNVGVTFLWDIYNIYIPKSIWEDKDDILLAITDAFSVYRNLTPENAVKEIRVKITCEPTCVEVDYNGR